MSGATSPIHLAVKEALDAGLAVLPPTQDGAKRPDVPSWRAYQKTAPRLDEVRDWYRDGQRTGIGVLTGNVSGGLEMLELEGRAVEAGLLGEFLALAEATGLGGLVARIEAGYTEKTPSGGIHWLYRVSSPLGNTKLARRPATAEELADKPDDPIKVLIETRGEGGYVVTAPSNGKVHPSGGAWTVTSGGFGSIATITDVERDALFSLCRTFDAIHETPRTHAPGPTGTDRPGDRYNARSDIQRETLDLLERHGWTRVYSHAGVDYLRRPGKRDAGVSASLGHIAPGVLRVFTTSSTFEDRAYDPFGVFAHLEHGGDFRAAALALEPPLLITGKPTTSPTASNAPEASATLPDLRDVFESMQDTTEYPFLVDRMLRLGYYALLAAYESTGKSYIATQLALSVISGRPVFGEFAVNESMAVAVFDMEMGEAEDRNRDRQMMADLGIDPAEVRGLYRRITLDDVSLTLKDPAHVEYIAAQLDALHGATGRPVLAVLDSTDSLVSKRPWGEDVEKLDAAISRIREGRRDWLVVLLLIHTKKKPSEGKGDYVRDLEDVVGNATRQADMVMVLDAKGDLALRCGIFKRPGRSAGILQRAAEGFAWTWGADHGESSTKVDPMDVLATLRDLCSSTETGRVGRAAMALKLGVTDTTADKYLRDLESRGLVESTCENTFKRRWEYWPVA